MACHEKLRTTVMSMFDGSRPDSLRSQRVWSPGYYSTPLGLNNTLVWGSSGVTVHSGVQSHQSEESDPPKQDPIQHH